MKIGKVKIGPGGVILIGLVLLALVYTGARQLGFDVKEYLTGSKSGGKSSAGVENTVRIAGSTTVNDNFGKDWAQAFMRKQAEARVLVEGNSTGAGVAALIKGEADIAAASRPVNAKEIQQAREKGLDLTTAVCEHTVGFDAIAVVVNGANPVNQMTVAQLRGIFSGEITDWAKVGGTGGPITVIVRPSDLGAYEVFKESILGKEGKFVDGAETIKANKDLADRIHTDPRSISFIAFNDVGSNKAVKIAATENSQAVAPSATSIRNRSYLLTRKLYLYTAGEPTGLVKEFLSYALNEGQDVVAKYGFVDMRVKLVEEAGNVPATAGKTSGSKRRKFNTDLRFNSGSFDLDNLAVADLEVISTTLCNSAQMNTLVELVGFADSMGKPEQNKALSLQRAEAVKILLQKKCPRLTVKTSGLGDSSPIGDNQTEDGRQLNRRVEIWVSEL
ncbi:MAG: substrate-binding domain-containing protein [Blastocatellia bacterium]|nr:substrate-binding domain-containing protein [Blastocatellia bacterium]